jgi:threonine/homoserine/homoserine lactone efflux protein
MHLGLFLSAALLLAITPGPGIFYVLARSLAGGRRAGILSSLGTFVGGFVHVIAAALGISAILAASALAFSVVKYAGAAYLIYLGIRMILSRGQELTDQPVDASGNAFSQGIVTEVLNPKTALFFLSFIPQFIVPAHNIFGQFLLLGTISVALNTSADVLVAFFAGPLGQRLKESVRFRRRQRTASGLAMIGLGAWVAVGDHP